MHSTRHPASLVGLQLVAAAVVTASALVGGGAAQADTLAPSTYYLDCSAAANGSGSSTVSPWNTPGAVQQHGDFAPGDRILVRRGTTCHGRITPSGSGTSAQPIVLGAYPGSGTRPVIAGGGTANATATVQLTNVQYWTVRDLRITNTSGGKTTKAYRSGLLFWNMGAGRLKGLVATNVLIDNVVSNLSYTGGNPREWGGLAALTSGPRSGFDGLQLIGNTVSKVGRTGIAVINHNYDASPDTSLRVSGNSVKDVRGDGILVFGSKNAQIDRNVVARAGSLFPCPQCENISRYTASAGIWPAQSTNVLITRNEVYGTRVANGDGEGFDIDASAKDVTLEYNYAHDNDGGAVLFCGSINAVTRFNIFENNGKSAFAFIGSMPAKNTKIYNNTVYQSKGTKASAVRTFNGLKGSGIRFYNNVVFNYGKGSWYWPNKVWSRSNTVVGVHKSGEPRGAGFSSVAPRLVHPGAAKNGFASLKVYKTAKGAKPQRGIAIPKTITKDFFGKKINPKKPPRGAAG